MPQAHSSQLQYWLVPGAPSIPSLSGLARFSCVGRANAPNNSRLGLQGQAGALAKSEAPFLDRRFEELFGDGSDNASFGRRLGTPQGEEPCQVVIILGVTPVGSTVLQVTHADSNDVEIQTESELEQASSDSITDAQSWPKQSQCRHESRC